MSSISVNESLKQLRGTFVIGTGTDIGKTYVAGLLLREAAERGSAGYYKAAMSGNDYDESGLLVPGDAAEVARLSQSTQSLTSMCPYVFEEPLSPHLAARIHDCPIERSVVMNGFDQVARSYEYVTVEGSGGIICPLRVDETDTYFLEDVVRETGLSCVLVARSGLGTINEVTLTTAYLRAHHIPISGIIYNDYHPGDRMEEDNLLLCEQLSGLPTLARVVRGQAALNLSDDVFTAIYQPCSRRVARLGQEEE